MGYLVFELPAVQEIPPRYRSTVEDLIDQLQKSDLKQYIGFLPFFEALGNGWFKKRYDKYRLIAKFYPIEVEGQWVPTVVLVNFLHRGDAAYGSGKADVFESLYANLLEKQKSKIQEAARNWINQSQKIDWQPPQPLPDDLLQMLEPLRRPTNRIDAFYLHPNFCTTYQRLSTDTQRAAVYKIMSEEIIIFDNEHQGELIYKEYDECKLYYVQLSFSNDTKCVLIIGVIPKNLDNLTLENEEKKIDEVWNIIKRNILSLPENTPIENYYDAISQLTELAFPDYLLADEELWQTVWKSEHREVFLALSSEEIQTLESLLKTEKLPAVIEGRAGSGKTTLLIYYAAERAIQHNTSLHRGLYLTQSEKLLEKAMKLIDKICERYSKERNSINQKNPLTYLTYHQFALQQIDQKRRERFRNRSRRAGWMDYYLFTTLLCGYGSYQYDYDRYICQNPFARSRDCNPEAVWFILRSYIKGYKISEREDDRWMTAQEYEGSDEIEIPTRDRQVSPELYREVWEHIWPWYKRLTIPCKDNSYEPPFWDDLDLAWEVILHRRSDAPEYAVAICDEVQDLTRVELAALLQSLSWTHYDLRLMQIQRNKLPLPIVLAGDAHQTINPSVFRWERVSADLAKTLVAHLPTLAPPKVERLELRFNYRNARSIGQLCNALQYLRQRSLGQHNRLQQLWRLSDRQPNQRIRRLIISANEELLHLLREGVLIIGPEDDDPNLQHTMHFWQALGCAKPPFDHPNYMVPAEIKGLEQDHVAVAGFGVLWYLWLLEHRRLADFWQWQEMFQRSAEVPEALRFQAEYFLNRLYVAVSRAREQLWIIETEEGWNSFWDPLENWLNHQFQQQAASPSSSSDTEFEPKGHTEQYAFMYSNGDINELIEVFRGNWERLAEEFEQLAHDQRSPDHAERSAYYYDRSERPKKRDEMQMYKLYYQGEVLEAAQGMLGFNYDVASDWLWEAAESNESIWEQMKDKRIRPDWRRRLATCMCALSSGHHSSASHVSQLTQIIKQYSSFTDEVKPEQKPTWDQVYLRLLQAANSLSEEFSQVQQEALAIAKEWTPLSRNQRNFSELLAKLAFKLRLHADATEHWERAGLTNHRDYFIAKAESSSYPECLRWWDSAGDYKRIMILYDARNNEPLGPDDRRRVARAAQTLQRWRTAFVALAGLDNEQVPHIWQHMLGEIYKNDQITEYIADIIRKVRQSYRDFNKQLSDSDFNEEWTNFLFDLIDTSDYALAKLVSQEKHPYLLDQIIRGLVYGLAEGSDAAALRPRFRGSWKSRKEEGNGWSKFQNYLQQIIENAYEIIMKIIKEHDNIHLQVYNLCRFVLGLLWQFRRREAERQTQKNRSMPRLQSQLVEYVCVPQEKTPQTVNYLEQVSLELRPVVQKALACVADLPENWIRNSGQDLQDWVEALSYDLHENLQHTISSAQDQKDVAPFEWWMLVGRFVEQAPFRRRARDYYRDLRRLAEEYGWPSNQRRQISERLRDYEQRYDRWHDEQQSQSREKMIYLGQSFIHRDIVEIYISNRAQLVIHFLPDRYQVRYTPPRGQIGIGDFRNDPEVRIMGPQEKEKYFEWQISCDQNSVLLIWDKELNIYHIKIDDCKYILNFE
jgi:hypothetical protein